MKWDEKKKKKSKLYDKTNKQTNRQTKGKLVRMKNKNQRKRYMTKERKKK